MKFHGSFGSFVTFIFAPDLSINEYVLNPTSNATYRLETFFYKDYSYVFIIFVSYLSTILINICMNVGTISKIFDSDLYEGGKYSFNLLISFSNL